MPGFLATVSVFFQSLNQASIAYRAMNSHDMRRALEKERDWHSLLEIAIGRKLTRDQWIKEWVQFRFKSHPFKAERAK